MDIMTRVLTFDDLLPDEASSATASGSEVVTTAAEAGTQPDSLYAVEDGNPPEAPSPPRRRGGRLPRKINTEPFADLVQEFLRAAALDPSYAISMCEAATTIESKRASWDARHDLRAADDAARSVCAASQLTSCEILNPCGTGPRCPFAPAEFRTIDVHPEGPRLPAARKERPQPRRGPGMRYTVESALTTLVAQRAAAQPTGRNFKQSTSQPPNRSADKEDRREQAIRRREEITAEVESLARDFRRQPGPPVAQPTT